MERYLVRGMLPFIASINHASPDSLDLRQKILQAPNALWLRASVAFYDTMAGMVTVLLQRPATRSCLTLLNVCEPPDTCMTGRVRLWIGRMLPTSSGSRSASRSATRTCQSWPRGAPGCTRPSLRPLRQCTQCPHLQVVCRHTGNHWQSVRIVLARFNARIL